MKFIVTVLLTALASVAAYKPVFVMHGIFGSDSIMSTFVNRIKAVHPGTTIYNLGLYNGVSSMESLPKQVQKIEDTIRSTIAKNPALFKDGYHLACHSQGALSCRALSVMMDDHNIDTLLSLAGPQNGVYDEDFFKLSGGFFPLPFSGTVVTEIYRLAYTSATQSTLSIANMWNDPNHQTEFFKANVFLPFINNQLDHADAARFKSNFLRVKRAIFISGDQGTGKTFDGGIGPWNSGIFGFVAGDGKTLVPMEAQDYYINDSFGLRTMNEEGRLTIMAPTGVGHTDWIFSKTIIDSYVTPFLT